MRLVWLCFGFHLNIPLLKILIQISKKWQFQNIFSYFVPYHYIQVTLSIQSRFTVMFYKIGASGGVYCLITAHLATLLLNWHDDIYIIKKRIRKGKIAQPKKRGVIIR